MKRAASCAVRKDAGLGTNCPWPPHPRPTLVEAKLIRKSVFKVVKNHTTFPFFGFLRKQERMAPWSTAPATATAAPRSPAAGARVVMPLWRTTPESPDGSSTQLLTLWCNQRPLNQFPNPFSSRIESPSKTGLRLGREGRLVRVQVCCITCARVKSPSCSMPRAPPTLRSLLHARPDGPAAWLQIQPLGFQNSHSLLFFLVLPFTNLLPHDAAPSACL